MRVQIKSVQVYPGVWFGIQQAVVKFELVAQNSGQVDWQGFDACFSPQVSVPPAHDHLLWQLSPRLIALLLNWQTEAGLLIKDQGRWQGQSIDDQTDVASLLIPYDGACYPVLIELTKWLLGLMSRELEVDWSVYKNQIAEWKHKLKHFAPIGSNAPHFLRAAALLDIPCIQLTPTLFQYGWGKQSVRLDSTFTENTSTIAANLARQKHLAARLLHQAGLPVAKHFCVQDVASAQSAVAKLGFPVVVKPADLDGGQGVTLAIKDKETLSKVVEQTLTHSPNVLVEQQVPGRDYRLTVWQDQLIWAIERQPAGVVGDGIHTVAELVAKVNQQRFDDSTLRLKPILLDEVALNLLDEQNLTLDSFADQGRFVQLQRVANVNIGGMPLAVNEQVHPDNAMLAIRAAQALRLDFAGVDLLIPDISVSWLESGATLCEVNAQPQLGYTTQQHLYAALLQAWLPQKGRIPIYLFAEEQAMSEFATRLQGQFAMVGCVAKEGVRLNNQRISSPKKLFDGLLMLLLDKNVEAIVALVDVSVVRKGLPCYPIEELHLPMPLTDLDANNPNHQTWLGVAPYCKNVTDSKSRKR